MFIVAGRRCYVYPVYGLQIYQQPLQLATGVFTNFDNKCQGSSFFKSLVQDLQIIKVLVSMSQFYLGTVNPNKQEFILLICTQALCLVFLKGCGKFDFLIDKRQSNAV